MGNIIKQSLLRMCNTGNINKKTSINDNKANFSSDVERYIKRNGFHFTELLAKQASIIMGHSNWDPDNKLITYLQINGYDKNINNHTLGDIIYLANILGSILYPSVITNIPDCIQASHELLSKDIFPDSMLFRHFLLYIKEHKQDIDLDEY